MFFQKDDPAVMGVDWFSISFCSFDKKKKLKGKLMKVGQLLDHFGVRLLSKIPLSSN